MRQRCSSILGLTVALFVVALPLAAAGGAAQRTASPVTGLEALFTPGPIFQDRNDDGVVDSVDAAIVVGEASELDDVAAAADVAARLGFETMAMDLPLPEAAGAGVAGILVGRQAVEEAGLWGELVGSDGLAEDEGVVALVADGERSWVVVAGADSAGTRAAASVFAGRLPRVWDPGGADLADVVGELRTFLEERQVAVGSVRAPRVRVRAGGDALEAVSVDVGASSPAAVEAARVALQDVVDGRPGADVENANLSYPGARRLRVRLGVPGEAPVEIEIPRVEPEPEEGPVAARPGTGAKEDLDLSNLYTPEGLLGDSDGDRIPDRTDVVLSPWGEGTAGTIDLAARLGLESAGVTLPIATPGDEVDDPAGEPTLVLVGAGHPLVQQLVEEGRLELPELAAGEGLIELVTDAWDGKPALVVTGGDADGVRRALEQVAERFPNLWDRGKDRPTVDDVEYDAWKFFAGRSPAGQAALALYKLDRIGDELDDTSLDSARVLVSLEKPAPGFDGFVRQRAAEALGVAPAAVEVELDDRDVQNAEEIFSDDFAVPSEVEEFWSIFDGELLSSVSRGDPVTVEVRLSEPAAVRARIAAEARRRLVEAGAAGKGTEVKVLSAYKQGFSWLTEVVQPQLQGRDVGEITIEFARLAPPPDWAQQAMFTPVRWLREIFPVDEVWKQELGIDLGQVNFAMTPAGTEPVYRVVATSPDGSEILRAGFDPKYVQRPYYDRFPDYEQVRVTTGWVYAESGGNVLVDRRVRTDAEAFWDHYQAETLPAIYDYVMARANRNPRPDDAPYFGELVVELELSEPNHRLGVDNEIIAPLDSVHEDVYFSTLVFFRLLGRMTQGRELGYVGRVVPIMRPRGDGEPGRARISLTGFATSRPAVVVDYTTAAGHKGRKRLDIPRVEMDRPSALAARVRAGEEGLERLDLRIHVNSEDDRRQELVAAHDAVDVDATVISAEQAVAVVANLSELRTAGMYADALAHRGLGELRVAAGWTWEVDREAQLVATLEDNGTPPPLPDIAALLPEGYGWDGGELVQWETPIPPPEAFRILAEMSVTFPEASAYKVGESYLGKELWAMDLMSPVEVSHWSHYKATTWKPTVVYSARQHANEVSSTSHVLKLAEILLTDGAFQEVLDKVNVVIHPITNADGAQLAYDLYEITPDFLLHAGYLGALGVDVTAGADDDMPIYPEAQVRPRLWETWLPDIFLNPHGYPSHELVQLFSGYSGLVRRGRVTERNWSYNKGWFIPGFDYTDDPRYPRHKDAAFEIRDRIVERITAAPEVQAMNQRNYDRYRRYGVQFDDDALKFQDVGGVLIYMPLEGSRGGNRGYDPRVTIWAGGTEAPDETAYGEWMEIVATAGLEWDKAILEYLHEGDHRVDRHGSGFHGGVRLSRHRPRPPETDDAHHEETGS